jgi:hypothetical protein
LGRRLRRVNRIALGAAVLIIALLITISSLGLGLLRQLSNAELQARMLAESAAPALMFQDKKAASEVLQPLRNSSSIVSARVYAPDATVFAQYLNEAKDARATVAPPQALPSAHHVLSLHRAEHRIDSALPTNTVATAGNRAGGHDRAGSQPDSVAPSDCRRAQPDCRA